MVTRFLIIKHLSLGYGVLLKRDSSGIGKIYFAERKAALDVSLSHPSLSVADDINLNKFVSLGLYEGLFDEITKQKAASYFDNRIKNMHLSENECYGAIIGTHEYSFRISIDTNSSINLSCTCPVNGICKHLYAVFVNIKKLIDPKSVNVLPNATNHNEFNDALQRFLYVRGSDNIALISQFSYQIKNLEKCQNFIEEAFSFYQRSQYKARMISDILAPLYFNDNNLNNFSKIKETASDALLNMFNEAEEYYQNLLNEADRKGRKGYLYRLLLKPDFANLIALLKHAEDNFNEERTASKICAEYLKYQDLTIDEILSLKGNYLFQVNHRFYLGDIMNSPAKYRLSTYLLFFDELPLDENKIKQIPLEYFLRVASFSDDKSHYIQIVHMYFSSLKEDEYPLLADLLIGVSLQHDYVDERTIRLSLELSKKLPNNLFINELVENNIRRPKKAQYR